MKGHLLVTTSVVVLLAVMVTLNLNSAAWAKDDYKTNSKESIKISENTNNRDINTQSNNTQTDNNENMNTGSNCDSPQCQKTLDNAMGMLNNLMKPILP